MKVSLAWLLLIFALFGAPVSQGEDQGEDQGDGRDATAWLMQINEAARQLNYSGRFVYAQGDHIESMEVTHRAGEESMRQRIYSLNGAPREVIRDAEQVWCYAPDKNLGVHEYRQASKQGFPNLLPEDVNHLARYYEIRKGRVGRIADRAAQRVEIIPKDDLRYGYDLWADMESGLLLKAALLSNDGRPIEQYLFTNVQIGGPISDAELQPVTADTELVWYGDAHANDAPKSLDVETNSAHSWGVEEMPPGFMLTREIKRLSSMSSNLVQHYVYSDGLATVSVFVEKLGNDASTRIKGLNKMGAIHAFGREIEGHQVTVVGEVPSQTVDIIGMSVYPKKQ